MLKVMSLRAYTAIAGLLFIIWFPKDWEDQAQAWAVWARWLGVLNREILLWLFSATLLTWLIWTDLRPYIQGRWPRFSPKHALLVQELAGPLAEADQVATTRLSPVTRALETTIFNHVMSFHEARQKVDRLTNQISYDITTVSTINDYLHLCSLIMHDELLNQDNSEGRTELAVIRGPLFQALHSGKSLDRNRLPLPQWMKEKGTKTAMESK